MKPENGEAAALRPLLLLAGGVLAGVALALAWGGTPRPVPAAGVLATAGLLALALALRDRRRGVRLLLAAGLALGFASGVIHTGRRARLRREAPDGTVLRLRATVLEGWHAGRWGTTTRVAVRSARAGDRAIRLPSSVRFEVGGHAVPDTLPAPGGSFEALVRIRHGGRAGDGPLLLAKSSRLLERLPGGSGLPALRQWLAGRLLETAGTSARAIRAAELAAGLALGRRDLLPAGAVERWRDSGLAHVLAVSGLHVGIVAALVWFAGAVAGLAPGPRRLAVVLATPAYALLAGAAPSAIRATVMVEVYMLARLFGRHLLPLGAVALTAAAMLLAAPALLVRPGFQLTVLVTAAILRWAPPLARRLPLPAGAAAAVAVPVTAQIAALPLAGWWFGRIVPAGIVTNLAGLALLPILIVAAIAAAALAAIWPPAAAAPLAVTGAASRLLLAAGAPARAHVLTLPHVPPAMTAAGALLLILTVLPGRTGRRALAAAALAAAALPILATGRALPRPGVALLPVGDGASVLLRLPDGAVLVDGGRFALEADRLLRDAGVRELHAVVATHTDQDHLGGLRTVLLARRVPYLLVPRWLCGSPEAAPLLRAARARGTRVVPLTQGAGVALGETRFDALWPPAEGLPPGTRENDRSLVLLARFGNAAALLPGDASRRVEPRYARAVPAGGLLVVPHHGSRGACSALLLARTAPGAALVPAAPGNPYHHPAPATLERLRRAGVPYRVARWTPWCAAAPGPSGRWRLAP